MNHTHTNTHACTHPEPKHTYHTHACVHIHRLYPKRVWRGLSYKEERRKGETMPELKVATHCVSVCISVYSAKAEWVKMRYIERKVSPGNFASSSLICGCVYTKEVPHSYAHTHTTRQLIIIQLCSQSVLLLLIVFEELGEGAVSRLTQSRGTDAAHILLFPLWAKFKHKYLQVRKWGFGFKITCLKSDKFS